MEWKFAGSKPVYQQIIKQMRAAVLAGEYPPGSRVPSVRELAAQARVNPNTMQRALTELEHEKILVSGGTAGRFVTKEQSVLDRIHQQEVAEMVERCAQKFRALGLTPSEGAALLMQMEEREEE